jgi:UDP-N-acetylmuramoyl-L-alanyl-D-glutamate--2,6-diaminopimelate ligase
LPEINKSGDKLSDEIIVEPDRRKAIFLALSLATPNDIVLIAGKGHEPYQEICGVKYPFNDLQVAREGLAIKLGGF